MVKVSSEWEVPKLGLRRFSLLASRAWVQFTQTS